MMKRLSVLFLLLVSGSVYAQKKNQAVIVVGRQLSEEENSRVRQLYYSGLHEKNQLDCESDV